MPSQVHVVTEYLNEHDESGQCIPAAVFTSKLSLIHLTRPQFLAQYTDKTKRWYKNRSSIQSPLHILRGWGLPGHDGADGYTDNRVTGTGV